jgi:hypothetical protein
MAGTHRVGPTLVQENNELIDRLVERLRHNISAGTASEDKVATSRVHPPGTDSPDDKTGADKKKKPVSTDPTARVPPAASSIKSTSPDAASRDFLKMLDAGLVSPGIAVTDKHNRDVTVQEVPDRPVDKEGNPVSKSSPDRVAFVAQQPDGSALPITVSDAKNNAMRPD